MRLNEDTRVKFPATVQFTRLGYEYQSKNTAIIDSETKIFVNRFKPSIEKINNRTFTDLEIEALLKEILSVLKNNDLGKEFYQWLIMPNERVKLIDFENIENNDFAVVCELPFGAALKGSFRPDITVLINGIPLAFLEVKPQNNDGGIQVEFKRMINDRLKKEEHKKYFNMFQVVSFSNNMEYETDDTDEDPKAGSFYSTPNGFKTSFNFFREEEKDFYTLKDIDEELVKFILNDNGYSEHEMETKEFQTDLQPTTPCNSFICSIFTFERLLRFIQYGIAYVEKTELQKHIMRYPQFFATKKIIERLKNGGNGGIIWHTQGSGKTALAAFSNRIIKDYFAKQGINTRFFFVVDRLDLLTQANNEFSYRALNTTTISDRQAFANELNKILPINVEKTSMGDFTVVNIHKFSDNMPIAKNDYNAKIQRVIFIDEAHRSYAKTGEFFKNLMLMDRDAIFIALTGTPLLNSKERSNLKFGDYIHKYFYDKSIADGYTLRIKKESIDTVAKADIKRNLDLENPESDKDTIYQSDGYIIALCKFIQEDFINFRYANCDKTIGGMIVCNSNEQARKVHSWFEINSELTTGLVISDNDIPNQVKKDLQKSFKENFVPDLLVAHQMLTTGYDVERLKKMYLLRNAKQHTLLQTISRVNRPYKNSDGKVYKYGYVVDFVDIEEEYDRTIQQYIKELETEISEEDSASLDGLVIDKNTIYEKFKKYESELLALVPIDNAEDFTSALTPFTKEKLLNVRRLLIKIKECHTEFLLSRADDMASQIDISKIKLLLKLVQNRIDFVNLIDRPTETLNILSNSEVIEIIYQFIKTKITIMDLSKFQESPIVEEVIDRIKKVQKGIKDNRHKEDIRIVKLNEFLQKIFNRLSIIDISDLNGISDELRQAVEELDRINKENERLSEVYHGSYAFVKTYNDYCTIFPNYESKDIETVLVCINDNLAEILNKNSLILQGRNNFINNVKQKCTVQLLKSKIYKKLNLKEWFDQLIGEIYINLQIYK